MLSTKETEAKKAEFEKTHGTSFKDDHVDFDHASSVNAGANLFRHRFADKDSFSDTDFAQHDLEKKHLKL